MRWYFLPIRSTRPRSPCRSPIVWSLGMPSRSSPGPWRDWRPKASRDARPLSLPTPLAGHDPDMVRFVCGPAPCIGCKPPRLRRCQQGDQCCFSGSHAPAVGSGDRHLEGVGIERHALALMGLPQGLERSGDVGSPSRYIVEKGLAGFGRSQRPRPSERRRREAFDTILERVSAKVRQAPCSRSAGLSRLRCAWRAPPRAPL